MVAARGLSLISLPRLDCNKPGNENRPFPGQKNLLYGTRDKTKNSGTVPDVSGHLATILSTKYKHKHDWNVRTVCMSVCAHVYMCVFVVCVIISFNVMFSV